MNGAAVAVAEHLDLDMTRRLEIFLEIERVVAERRLGFGARGRQGRSQFRLRARHLHAPPAAALISSGNPKSAASLEASSSEAMAASEPGTTASPSRWAVRLASILSPISRMCSGLGPMKCTLCSARISANRAFSDKKP